jgi:hypothetical protein
MAERSKIINQMRENLRQAQGDAVPRSALFKDSTGSTNRHTQDAQVGRLNQDLGERNLIARSTEHYQAFPLSSTAGPFPTAEQLGITSTGAPVLHQLHSIAQSCSALPGTTVLDMLYGDRKEPLDDERSAFHYQKSQLSKLLRPHDWGYGMVGCVRVFRK